MKDRFYRLWFLLRKELIQMLKSPKTRLAMLLPPLLQMLVFGYAASMDLKRVDFAILDHSRSVSSRSLSEKFSGNAIFHAKAPLQSEKELAKRLDEKDILLALVIPENFERDLQNKSNPQVQIIIDGRNSSTAGIASSYAQSIIELFNQSNQTTRQGIRIESRAWYNPNYSAQYFLIPALLAMLALLDLMLITALSVAKEREEGTFDQLLLTPYNCCEILLVKGCATMIIGICQLTISLIVALLWYKVPFNSSFGVLYCLFGSFMFASVNLGLLISVLCRNMQQAMLGSVIVSIPFVMLSGLATPLESIPKFLQNLTIVNPMRYGIKALHRIFLEGAGYREILGTYIFLMFIGLTALGLASLIFRQQKRN